MIPLWLGVIAVCSYLIGTINAVSVTSRLVFRRRMRPRSGEAAIQAVNRIYGLPGVIAVTVVDIAKTIVAVLLSGMLLHVAGGEPIDSIISYTAVGRLFSTFCVLLGHCFPVFFGFRGGKGGVVALVGMLCTHFPLGVLCALIVVGTVAATRYLSLGTLIAAVVGPLGIWLELGGLCALLAMFCALILFVRHWPNILRLIRRIEPKLDFKQDLSMKFEREDF